MDDALTGNFQAFIDMSGNVATNAGDIQTNADLILGIETRIDDEETGLVATASGISSLSAEVEDIDGVVNANSQSIQGVQTAIDDPDSGLNATASAITELETNVGEDIADIWATSTMKVDANGVISSVRLDAAADGTSTIRLDAKHIHIGGATTFDTGLDPSDKEDVGTAAGLIASLEEDLSDAAYTNISQLEEAIFGETIIVGGVIKTSLIDVDDLFAQNIMITGNGKITNSEDDYVIDSSGMNIAASDGSNVNLNRSLSFGGSIANAIGLANQSGSTHLRYNANHGHAFYVGSSGRIVMNSAGTILHGNTSINEASIQLAKLDQVRHDYNTQGITSTAQTITVTHSLLFITSVINNGGIATINPNPNRSFANGQMIRLIHTGASSFTLHLRGTGNIRIQDNNSRLQLRPYSSVTLVRYGSYWYHGMDFGND